MGKNLWFFLAWGFCTTTFGVFDDQNDKLTKCFVPNLRGSLSVQHFQTNHAMETSPKHDQFINSFLWFQFFENAQYKQKRLNLWLLLEVSKKTKKKNMISNIYEQNHARMCKLVCTFPNNIRNLKLILLKWNLCTLNMFFFKINHILI